MGIADIRARLSVRTMTTLGVCLLAALGFVAVFLIPDVQEAAALRLKISALHADIALQRQLLPLRLQLRKAEAALPPADFAVTPRPLPLRQVGQLAAIVEKMANPLGVRVDAVKPEASSAGKNGQLAVSIRLHGPIDALRKFLLALCQYAPLRKIASASTQYGPEGRELALTCWLTVR